MAATLTFYNSFKETIADGTIDLDTHTFKVMLTTSSYTPSAAHTTTTDITNEVSSTNTGYTTGGAALTSVTWGQTGGTATFDADNVVWTAGSANLTARYAVVYDDTATNNDLVCYITLDSSDVTATNGNTFTIAWNASGIFTLA